jgi:hypothetical protein
MKPFLFHEGKTIAKVKSSAESPQFKEQPIQSKQKPCVCMLGIVVLLLQFSASGWADKHLISLSFLSLLT